jgi:hypothetical protein
MNASIKAMTLGVALAAIAWASSSAVAGFVPIDFSIHHNAPLRSEYGGVGGALLLGGVPFYIPEDGDNTWQSGNGPANGDEGIHRIDIAINKFGISRVHTLISTFWGEAASGRLMLEFFGSKGAYHMKDMIGNSDIRDWAQHPGWTTTINGTTTVNVLTIPNAFEGHDVFFDMQTIELPGDFNDETLMTIRLTDNREVFRHSGILMGVTIVPEPAAIVLVGLGLLSLLSLCTVTRKPPKM